MALQRADLEGLVTNHVELRPKLHGCAEFNHASAIGQHGAMEWPHAAFSVGDFTETNSTIELSDATGQKVRLSHWSVNDLRDRNFEKVRCACVNQCRNQCVDASFGNHSFNRKITRGKMRDGG